MADWLDDDDDDRLDAVDELLEATRVDDELALISFRLFDPPPAHADTQHTSTTPTKAVIALHNANQPLPIEEEYWFEIVLIMFISFFDSLADYQTQQPSKPPSLLAIPEGAK